MEPNEKTPYNHRELIQIVKGFPELWREENLNYNNAQLKRDLWCKVAQHFLEERGAKCALNWSNLKSAYERYFYAVSRRSSQSARKIQKPDYAEELQFLNENFQLQPRKAAPAMSTPERVAGSNPFDQEGGSGRSSLSGVSSLSGGSGNRHQHKRARYQPNLQTLTETEEQQPVGDMQAVHSAKPSAPPPLCRRSLTSPPPLAILQPQNRSTADLVREADEKRRKKEKEHHRQMEADRRRILEDEQRKEELERRRQDEIQRLRQHEENLEEENRRERNRIEQERQNNNRRNEPAAVPVLQHDHGPNLWKENQGDIVRNVDQGRQNQNNRNVPAGQRVQQRRRAPTPERVRGIREMIRQGVQNQVRVDQRQKGGDHRGRNDNDNQPAADPRRNRQGPARGRRQALRAARMVQAAEADEAILEAVDLMRQQIMGQNDYDVRNFLKAMGQTIRRLSRGKQAQIQRTIMEAIMEAEAEEAEVQ